MAKKYTTEDQPQFHLCEPIAEYSKATAKKFEQLELFKNKEVSVETTDIPVVELFAGVGGFRIGLERASKRYKTVWNNQWEPSTKRQDASIVYCERFGSDGHSNKDIATVEVDDIPDAKLLVGGFPCQDYSVATTLKNSKGIEGKKGVLWWQIYRILDKKGKNAPEYLFLENVDRLLGSPASQRGRDFAIILASLSDLGYAVEWRVINAADYGMPQRRRRTYIVAYKKSTSLYKQLVAEKDKYDWIFKNGVFAPVFPSHEKEKSHRRSDFMIEGDLVEVTKSFNLGQKETPFGTAGFMVKRNVVCTDVEADVFTGKEITLGDVLIPEAEVPEDFFITDVDELGKWTYLKGSKSEERTTPEGFTYHYSEGGMAFPDDINKPSRTIITGEGGKAPSRFKHVVLTPSGRYRRLVPIELERLNMFPDNHTLGASDIRRAFLMGNALVTGIIERVGLSLLHRM